MVKVRISTYFLFFLFVCTLSLLSVFFSCPHCHPERLRRILSSRVVRFFAVAQNDRWGLVKVRISTYFLFFLFVCTLSLLSIFFSCSHCHPERMRRILRSRVVRFFAVAQNDRWGLVKVRISTDFLLLLFVCALPLLSVFFSCSHCHPERLRRILSSRVVRFFAVAQNDRWGLVKARISTYFLFFLFVCTLSLLSIFFSCPHCYPERLRRILSSRVVRFFAVAQNDRWGLVKARISTDFLLLLFVCTLPLLSIFFSCPHSHPERLRRILSSRVVRFFAVAQNDRWGLVKVRIFTGFSLLFLFCTHAMSFKCSNVLKITGLSVVSKLVF